MKYIKGGWMSYVSELKCKMSRNLADHEMKFVMENYLSGLTIDETLGIMPESEPILEKPKKGKFQ